MRRIEAGNCNHHKGTGKDCHSSYSPHESPGFQHSETGTQAVLAGTADHLLVSTWPVGAIQERSQQLAKAILVQRHANEAQAGAFLDFTVPGSRSSLTVGPAVHPGRLPEVGSRICNLAGRGLKSDLRTVNCSEDRPRSYVDYPRQDSNLHKLA